MHGTIRLLYIALIVLLGIGSFFVWCSRSTASESRRHEATSRLAPTSTILHSITSAREERITGTIVEIAKDLRRLTIETADGQRITLEVDALATLRFKGAHVEIIELRTGDRISAIVDVQNRKKARTILIERDD